MQKYLYLFIDFLSLLFPLLFSFHPKANFSKKWKYLWPAILFPAIFFIAWDEWFVQMGIWGFNERYITGIYLLHLPLEEILFFISIPYACVFIYEAVGHFFPYEVVPNNGQRITWLLIPGLLLTGLVKYDLWYTVTTSLFMAAFLLFLSVLVKPAFMGRFYFAYFFILIPFFLLNGILTGTGLPEPVVWYNDHENLGIRLFTIPFEDTFYGMLLILMNVSIFEYLQKRAAGT